MQQNEDGPIECLVAELIALAKQQERARIREELVEEVRTKASGGRYDAPYMTVNYLYATLDRIVPEEG